MHFYCRDNPPGMRERKREGSYISGISSTEKLDSISVKRSAPEIMRGLTKGEMPLERKHFAHAFQILSVIPAMHVRAGYFTDSRSRIRIGIPVAAFADHRNPRRLILNPPINFALSIRGNVTRNRQITD